MENLPLVSSSLYHGAYLVLRASYHRRSLDSGQRVSFVARSLAEDDWYRQMVDRLACECTNVAFVCAMVLILGSHIRSACSSNFGNS